MFEAGYQDLMQTFLYRSENKKNKLTGWAVQWGDLCITLMEQPRTFEVEDSEFLCRRRLG